MKKFRIAYATGIPIGPQTVGQLLATLVAMLLVLLSTTGNAAEKIRVRVTQFAPNYYLQDGQWTGLDVQLAEAVIREAGYTLEFVDLPWSRALGYMQSSRIDMMMNLSRTPDREVFMDFIGPERVSKRVLVVRRENTNLPIASLDDLAKLASRMKSSFGIQKDAKYSATFDARFTSDPDFAEHFDAVPQGTLLSRKTAAGHNLGFFEDKSYVIYQLRTNPDFHNLAIHPFVLATDPVYFGVGKHLSAPMLKKLDGAFHRLAKNGALTRIRARWETVSRRSPESQ